MKSYMLNSHGEHFGHLISIQSVHFQEYTVTLKFKFHCTFIGCCAFHSVSGLLLVNLQCLGARVRVCRYICFWQKKKGIKKLDVEGEFSKKQAHKQRNTKQFTLSIWYLTSTNSLGNVGSLRVTIKLNPFQRGQVSYLQKAWKWQYSRWL